MPSMSDHRLLLALAEELKSPLLHIARRTELVMMQGGDASQDILDTTDMALRLVDGYLLSLYSNDQIELQLEPVAVSSVLYDAAQRLNFTAKQQGYELQIDVGHKYGPIMGNRKSLETAFTILGYSLMAQGSDEATKPTLTLAMHRSTNGLVTGAFTDNPLLTADAFRRARALSGAARQSLPGVSAANGAGIFIADSLLRTISAPLRVARHHKHIGLAATLLPSKQLRLV